MTNRWVNPINNNILRDLQDNVLASGSVAFYEAGTSTPLAVYSDPELTVSLGSYIDADAYGLLPDFHMASGTQYKAVAYDAIGGAGGAGAVKWTRDDVFGADSSVDTRLDALESTVSEISASSNALVNGGMRVTSGTATTLTTSYLEGAVFGTYGKVASVTAGTLTQAQDDDYASGYVSIFSGVSTDNAAATVDTQFRIQSKDSFQFMNGNGVFSAYVEHDVGSSVNYTIAVSVANAADDFSSVTNVLVGSATAVANATRTQITLPVEGLGDCSNGIAITISAACGIVTTKNFKIGEAKFESGLAVTDFVELPFGVSKAALRGLPPGHVNGMYAESDTDTDHDIIVSAGSCRDDNDSFDIVLTSSISKRIDDVWAAGNGSGGRFSGATFTGPAWMYFFVIARPDGTVDAGFDDNIDASNRPSSYLYYRHIASARINASENIDLVICNVDIGKKRFEEYITTTGANTYLWPPLVPALNFTFCGGGGQGDGGTPQAGGDTTVTYNSVSAVAGGGPGGGAASAGGQPSGSYDFGMPGQGVSNNGWGGDCPMFGCGGKPRNVNTDSPGYGGGGGGATVTVYAGTGAASVIKTFDYVQGQETVSVTIGAGGSTGSGAAGGNGAAIVRF